MRFFFLKHELARKALHKRQVFLVLSVGLRLGNYPPKRSSPPRPGCIGLTHCISIFSVIFFPHVRDSQSLHLPRSFPCLVLGPLCTLQGLWSLAPCGSRCQGAPRLVRPPLAQPPGHGIAQ